MMSDRQARLAALAAKAGRLPQQSMVHPKDNENSNDDNVADRGNNDNDNDGKSSTNKPTLSFRNYVPKDASLDAPPPIDDASNNNGDKQLVSNKRQKTSTITKNNKESSSSSSTTTAATPPKSALEIALAKTNREARLAAGQSVGGGTGLDESSGVSAGGGWNAVVTPSASTKKVNWDLKRDVQHKMDKLEKRTQRAIVQLLRERLEREAAVGDDDDDEVGDID